MENMTAIATYTAVPEPQAAAPQKYHDPHLEVDFTREQVSLDSRDLVLTKKEYELLALLVRNAGEIVSRDTLLWRVWGYSREIRTRTLDVHIRRLRKALEEHGFDRFVQTVRGSGYRFSSRPDS